MNATTTQFDARKIGYQPLFPYSMKRIGSSLIQNDKEANDEAKEELKAILVAAGFRHYDANPALSGWYSSDRVAAITVVINREPHTIGIDVANGGAIREYVNHCMDGTYDGLPLAEKHRLSGSGGTLESWLALFDSCGKKRPGDRVA